MASAQTKRTVGCLFSGMGGFASGLNDSSASAVFRHRFPNVTFLEKDVHNLSVGADRLSEVDVLAAGFPCQSFSQAGGRRGLEDPRGRLFFDIPRLLAEFEPARRPRLIILENVPYLLYGAGKAWFDVIRRAIRRAGYWFREDSCWVANVKDASRPRALVHGCRVARAFQLQSFRPSRFRR